MTPVAVRGDSPAALALNETALVARSAGIVQAGGYQLIPLSCPLGPWVILAVCAQGFLLVSVVKDAWPSTLGHLWGHPAGFPVNTRRVIHCWTDDKPLPEALSL